MLLHMHELVNENVPRLLRGGTFDSTAAFVRSAHRYWAAPSDRDANCGFRPCRTFP